MNKIILFLFFAVISCNNSTSNQSTKLTFDSLFGKVLSCSYNTITTKLFFYSPHIIGVPIKEDGFEYEYFHSVGSKKETNSIYFESSFMGKSNFQTKQTEKNNQMRRLKMTIENEKLFVTAINQIDEKMVPVNPVLYECEKLDLIKFNLP